MSKQASLFSFFSPKSSTPKSTDAGSPSRSAAAPTTPKSTGTKRAPLKRVNSETKKKKSSPEEKATPKRRRVLVSSDEEEKNSSTDDDDDDGGSDEYEPPKDHESDEEEEEGGEEEMEEEKEEEETPKKRKRPKKSIASAQKKGKHEKKEEDVVDDEEDDDNIDMDVNADDLVFDSAMADSFINTFAMREDLDMNTQVREMVEKEAASEGGEERAKKKKNEKERKDEEDEEEEEPDKPVRLFDGKGKNEDEGEEQVDVYVHETLAWLKPDKLCDAAGRPASHPEYDPSTLKVPPSFIAEQSPGHQQWWTLKAANFDTVLLFKVGKFYELYHMDATVAVNCLNLAYMKGKFAHCGFPESAYGRFADQLVERGYKVARVEQTEKPEELAARNAKEKNTGKSSKVVRRELCRVTTVGTRTYDVMETPTAEGGDESAAAAAAATSSTLGDSSCAYLLAIKETTERNARGMVVSHFGVAFIDTSIGRFHVGSFIDDNYFSHLRTLIARHPPAQVLVERNGLSNEARAVLQSMIQSHVPIETMTPKKEFIDASKTLSMLLEPQRLSASTKEWPSCMRALLAEGGEGLPAPRKDHERAWQALGALLKYLQRCLIDVDMVTMRQFERFDPTTAVHNKEEEAMEENGEGRNEGCERWRGKRMVIDGVGLEQLSLVPLDYAADETSSSLFGILNKCHTPCGTRLLRSWICAPSCDPHLIQQRQLAVLWLRSPAGAKCATKLEDMLDTLPDVERLLQKIHSIGLLYRAREHPDGRAVMFEAETYGKRKIKDLVAALDAFKVCQQIGELCESSVRETAAEERSQLVRAAAFDVNAHLAHFEESFDRAQAERDGKIVPKRGADEEFDAAFDRVEECKAALEEFRADFSRMHDCKAKLLTVPKDKYVLEVPEKTRVPSSFESKGGKKGFNRITSPALRELVSCLMEAEADKECLLKDATRKMFADFDARKSSWSSALDALSTLDVLLSLAKYADSTGVEMCCPEFVYEGEPVFEVEESYHPSIIITGLTTVGEDGEECAARTFIPNDVRLGGSSPRCLLLTGPNMGGKSTLMRQTAVLIIIAHMGSLVPARRMRLSPVDRIFTRIGASDKLVAGQSTFFVEMNESAIALRDATKHSLAVFDELGRGTGTLEGQSLAYAILTTVNKRIGARCIFSTHYHALCDRFVRDKDVALMHMGCVVENEEETAEPSEESVVFLYKLLPGVCPRSFGFHAAKLAGIDDRVIRESWRAARRAFGDEKALKALHDAASDESVAVEELRRMVEECF